jgi:flagellar hook-associated protein 3 FlgL
MKQIDTFSDNIVNFRTKIGAVDNRLESAQQRNESDKVNLTSALSERQDVDIAEKYMEYQNQMLAYQTTMAMGTKIMQTTILDYVR